MIFQLNQSAEPNSKAVIVFKILSISLKYECYSSATDLDTLTKYSLQ